MKSWSVMILALVLVMVGCRRSADDSWSRNPTISPTTAHLSGTVTYPSGEICWRAQLTVTTESTAFTTFTDEAGDYRFTIPLGDSVRIFARDGYTPGRVYGVTHYNRVSVSADHDRVVNIVLSHETPI